MSNNYTEKTLKTIITTGDLIMADKPVDKVKKKQPNWRQKRKKRAKKPVKESRFGRSRR